LDLLGYISLKISELIIIGHNLVIFKRNKKKNQKNNQKMIRNNKVIPTLSQSPIQMITAVMRKMIEREAFFNLFSNKFYKTNYYYNK
jgi:hypothetical protein